MVRHIGVVTLETNRKSYRQSTAPLDLTLSDIEGQSQGHSAFETLYHVNEPS